MPTATSSPDPLLESQLFWDRNKKKIVAALIFAVLAMAAFGGYRIYTNRRNGAAADLLAGAKTASDFQKVITHYPGTGASASAALFVAEEQRREKRFAEANATLQHFIESNPKHELAGTARMAMAANLESLGKRDEALTMYQRLAANDPHGFNAPIALISEVRLLKEKNQIDEARRVCGSILTNHRDSAIAGEATRQLRLLKGGSEPATSGAPTASVAQPSLAPGMGAAVPGELAAPGQSPAKAASPKKP